MTLRCILTQICTLSMKMQTYTCVLFSAQQVIAEETFDPPDTLCVFFFSLFDLAVFSNHMFGPRPLYVMKQCIYLYVLNI